MIELNEKNIKQYFIEGQVFKQINTSSDIIVIIKLGDLYPDQTLYPNSRTSERYTYKHDGWQGGDYILDHSYRTGPIRMDELMKNYSPCSETYFEKFKIAHEAMKLICNSIKI